jgi:hypothetical protein
MVTKMDLEYAHRRLMAALDGIAAGKKHHDAVSVPGDDRPANIFEALKDAGEQLKERFHAHELAKVDAAFKARGLVRTSDRKDEVATALLAAMMV